MRPERLAVPEYRPIPEPRPEPSSGGRLAGVLAVLAFLAVLALVIYRTASIVNVPGTPGPAGRGLQDFRDAIYYPVVAMLDGQNPYDPAAYMARYPVGDTFPLYLPATLLVYLPLGLLSYVTAEWTHFAVTAALTLVIAGLALAIARRRVSVASLFALAAAILLSRPGYWNLFLGQCTAVVVVGTYLALHFGRDRPGLGALGVALALLKPTYGVPLALLLLARRDVRPVLLGGLIAAAASIGPALVLLRNAGGLMPFLASIPAGQVGFEASVEVNPVTSTYRLDAVALIGRLAGGTFPGMDAIVFVGVMLIAAVALARLATREAEVGARLALPLACLAILTATYHQSYDALLLAAPLVLLVAAPVPGAGAFGRLLLLGLLAIPVGNHLASTRIMSAPHATWLAVVSLNGAAILAAFVVYVALAFRRPDVAPRSTRLLLVVVLVLGAAMRIATIGRPMDHRSLAPWREADYTQIARNFWREGMDVRYPRVDWRGDTPGFAEMEFPAVPWIGGLLFRAFGYHEPLLRLPTALFGILGLLVFARLAAGLLPPPAALFATAAFAVNPLLVYLGSAIQPDPLMLLLSLVAIGLIWRWDDDDRPASLLAASLAVGIAILTKSPAAHLGLVLAWVALRKRGLRALVDPMIVGGAVLALLPPLVWYVWANRFWHLYALSLGLSNETHFTSTAMLFPPRFLYGVLRWETLGIFTPAGWLLALVAFRWREGRVERAAVWYGAVWVFYLATAGTSGDGWSFYYHAVSTAPGCLLMGCGFAALSRGDVLGRRWEPTAGAAIAVLTLVSLVAGTGLLLRRRDTQPDYLAMRTCALRFVDRVAPGEKVVVDGGAMYDEYGLPVAHNESMVFTWMDRKGFNYGHEELSAGTLDRLAARGARFWMVRHDAVRGDLVDVARTRYRLVDDCDEGYALYDLRPGASRG